MKGQAALWSAKMRKNNVRETIEKLIKFLKSRLEQDDDIKLMLAKTSLLEVKLLLKFCVMDAELSCTLI